MTEEPAKKKRKWPRRLLGVLLALLLLSGLAFVAVQTPPAKRFMAARLSAVLATSLPWPVELGGVGGVIPFVVTLDTLQIGAENDPWLELRDAALNMEILPLLRGQIAVERVGVGELVLHRLPEAAEDVTEESAPFVLPELTDLPAWIRLGQLQVDRFTLGEAVAGTAASFRIDGGYHPEKDESFHLDLRGIDTTKSGVVIAGGLRRGAASLTVEATDENILAALTGADGPFTLNASLQGPLSDASLNVEATRSGEALVTLDTTVHYGEPLGIEGTGRIQLPADLVPVAVTDRVGGTVEFDLDVSLEGGDTIRVARGEVRAENAVLALDGQYSLEGGSLAFTPALTSGDFYRLLGMPHEGDGVLLEARVPLSGSLSALDIRPVATLGGEPWIGGELAVSLGGEITASGDVTIHPAGGLIPADYETLLAGGGALSLDLAYGDGRITLKDTEIRVGENALAAAGTINTGASVMDLQVEGALGDIGALEGIAGTNLAGVVRISLSAKGDASGTVVTGTLTAEGVEAATVRVPGGTLAIDLAAGAFPDALTERLEAKLSGQFPGIQLAPDLTRSLDLGGVVTVDDLQRISVQDFTLSDGNVEVAAGGAIQIDSRAADFRGTIAVDEIGDYASIAELPYRGAASIQLNVASGDSAGTMIAQLNGALSNLSGLPAEVQGLTGSSVTLGAEGQYDGESVSLDDVTLAGAMLKASGRGVYVLKTKHLEATLAGDLERIAPLSSLAGRPLRGAASFTLDAAGPVDALDIDAAIRGNELDLDVIQAGAAEVTVIAKGVPTSTDASVSVTLVEGGAALTLQSELRHRADMLTIDRLDLVAGDNRISVRGALNLETLGGHGDLDASLPDLSQLKAWINRPLAGSANLTATLAEDTGALAGQLSADGLVVSQVRVARAEGTFDLAQVFDAPSGTLNLTATDLDAGEFHMASLSLNGDGPPSGLKVELQSDGVFREFTPFNVNMGGVYSQDSATFDLRGINFGVESFTFTLRDQTSLAWKDGVVVLSPLVLESESGRLELAGTYGPESVDARAHWNGVSLRLVELAGIDPIDGAVSGTVAVTGDIAAPRLSAKIQVAGYNPGRDPLREFPGLDAELTAEGADGALRVDVIATVPEETRLQGDVILPMIFSLSPWAFSFPQGAPVTGKLAGKADLTVVPPLLAWEGDDLQGDLVADLKLGGSLGTPDLRGMVTVADGYYEIGRTSTILNNMDIELVAAGKTIRLTKFSGDDGAGGAISGTGKMTLDPDAGSPYEFALTLDRPRLVHRDDFRAQGAGELKLKGDAEGAVLSGNLAVSPVYATIPEGSGETNVTTVEFTEAGAPDDGTDEAAPPNYEFGLDLAIDFPGKVFITGPGLESEWDGKLHIRNHAADPSVEGVLRVKKGTLDFLGRVFNLAESTITFDGQTPPAPYLSIDAVTTTDDIEAHVKMEGTQDNLNLTLESEPSLPRDEILSRVLFGQRLSDVSPVQALTLARYAPMFKRNVSGRSVLGSEGPKPFLVDRISLNSGTDVGEASLTTGKYLNDDFYLEFQQGLGSAESLVSLDWLFAPQWSLKGKTTSRGEGGFGVYWKKNY